MTNLKVKLKANGLNSSAIETIARNIFAEARRYGFTQSDYIRLVNMLLDLTTENIKSELSLHKQSTEQHEVVSDHLPITGEHICLREMKETDLKLATQWTKDDFGRHFLLSSESFISTSVEDIFRNTNNIVSIITLLDGAPIGMMAFLGYDQRQKKAELRKLIGDPAARGKGFAKEASRHWINYGIAKYGLHKIFVSTINTQIKNIKLNEDLGFYIEGLLKEECYFDNNYHDVLRMGLLISRSS